MTDEQLNYSSGSGEYLPRNLPTVRPQGAISLDGAKNACWYAGRQQATLDKRDEDIPSYEQLESLKVNAVYKYLKQEQPHLITDEPDVKTVVHTLESSYVEGYCDPFGIAPNEAKAYFDKHQTRDIRALARRDREDDIRNNIQLSEPDIELQGAIRAVKELNLSTRSGTYYMQQVRPYAKAYAKYYRAEEGEDNFRRST